MDFDRTATTKADVVRAVTTGKATTASIDFSETIVRVYLSARAQDSLHHYRSSAVRRQRGDQALRAETRNHAAGCGDHDLRNAQTQLGNSGLPGDEHARLSGRGLTRGSRVIAFCSVADEWGVSAHPGGPCVPTANSPVSLRVRSAAFSRPPRGTRL